MLATFGWLIWQLYAPKFFGVDTRFQEVVQSLNERIDNVGERIDDVEARQQKIVAVTEVIAVTSPRVDGEEAKKILEDEHDIDRDPLYKMNDKSPSGDD